MTPHENAAATRKQSEADTAETDKRINDRPERADGRTDGIVRNLGKRVTNLEAALKDQEKPTPALTQAVAELVAALKAANDPAARS